MPTITLHSSKIQALLLVALHGAALLSLLLSGADPRLRLLLAALILLLPALRQRDCGRQQLSLGAGFCRLERSGVRVDLLPPRSKYLSEWLVILDFPQRPDPGWRRGRQRRWRMLFWPDSLTADDHWRLRRYLENLPPDPFSVAAE